VPLYGEGILNIETARKVREGARKWAEGALEELVGKVRAAGLDVATVEETVAYMERLFAPHLHGKRLLTNKSAWGSFPTVRNASWHHRNLVLLGDAAHTAHFSIGSGTKLAMEDSLALAACLHEHGTLEAALEAYETERRPVVESTQRAAQASMEWFENIGQYKDQDPVQFCFNLLTRSRRMHAVMARMVVAAARAHGL